MTQNTPQDSLDQLIAGALHNDLTAAEHNEFTTRLQNDPAARMAYQKSQLMHDLLEKTHRNAQPDSSFEQRMVSGIRRKLQHEGQTRETHWESVVFLWRRLKALAPRRRSIVGLVVVIAILLVVVRAPITSGIKRSGTVSNNLPGRFEGVDQLEAMKEKQVTVAVAAQAPPMAPAPGAPVADAAASSSTPKELLDANSKFSAESSNSVVDSASEMRSSFAPATTDAPSMPLAPAFPNSIGSRAAVKTLSPDNSGEVSALASKAPSPVAQSTAAPSGTTNSIRKLIRNAQLDLEVKSFQSTVDVITSLVNAGGGYVDISNSQRGGNGKLQGTLVVKVLPQNLDAFLLKLRDLGELKNQAIGTDDVTKEYYDIQARLDNSRRMETQLQELLKRDNGKVSDLLQVERELGRVRGDIEQMQGQLKLYDFQVQYATVTINVQEKDLTQAAAYLLKEHDEFSLFSTNVENAFQQARQTADSCQGHILEANLNHQSGSDVSAELVISVPPEQIETFLTRIKGLGRVDNFTRRTERIARDGGDTDQPADQAATEKDNVLVHIGIRSDDEARKQVALTVVTPEVDTALDQAKVATLALPGAEVVSSSFQKTPQGTSTGQITMRVPGKGYANLLAALRALGRSTSFSVERDDNAGPNAAGDDAPVIISLTLTDDETPIQQTEISILSSDIDTKAQQLKKDAINSEVEVKASSFEREPDAEERAQMTFRLALTKYPAFMQILEKLGRIESLSVHREDLPNQARPDEGAPVEINLQLHSEGDVVSENGGLGSTLRQTLGEGAAALFGSIKVIGVILAFLVPWIFFLGLIAWIARRVYVSRHK
jgi:hypothetical protein